MPNVTDDSRLNDTTRGAVVVDLAAYRERAQAAWPTAMSLFDPVAIAKGAWILVAIFVAILFFRARR